MRLGQVMELLDARAEAHAEPLAPPEGDERVRELVAAAESIGPGIHVAEDAVHAIRRGEHEHGEAAKQHGKERREVPSVHAAQKEHRERARGNHDERAEVGLAQEQPGHDQHHREHGQQAPLEALQHAMLAHGVIGGIEHGGELHQLGGLHAHDRQREPPPRAVYFTTNAGDQHRDEQRHAGEEKQRRRLLPVSCRHEEHHQRPGERHGEEHAVAHQEPRRAVAGVAVLLRRRNRRGVDHHQPGRREKQSGPGKRTVVFGGRGVARGHEGLAHGSARTAAANASPRSL